jgi:geranylgeranyl pyrophosphate synthase
MIGGQVLDMESENKQIKLAALKKIHKLKTGALFSACFSLPLYCNNKTSLLKPFSIFSSNIGLAFQIADDILDVTATSEQLGKDAGSDIKNSKSTYVSLLGLEKAKKEAEKCITLAVKQLDTIPGNTTYLRDLAYYIISRTN